MTWYEEAEDEDISDHESVNEDSYKESKHETNSDIDLSEGSETEETNEQSNETETSGDSSQNNVKC